ncbi:hypothetical protein F8O07_06945 [Pseudoclavibacter sp. CFCC 13796]|uniref:hypothetical protein n=1 Tax=Pseudoclavibacter sp. CFCC 13796 TaxID=2615179 RepID=UPI0013012E59|nr:hypothetical protein [Pseudoclavibacter sp. CFCC 13796]KAB1661636.1 hypothetical protein F8O07_06945 [Pseudoclavibacter sp. CFCC 13796]
MKHRTPVVAAAALGVALVLAGCAESPEHQQAASDCNQARDDLSAAIESFQTIGSDQEVSRALQAKAEDIGQTGTDAQAAIQKALGTTVDEDVPECSGGTDQLNSTADDLQNRKSSAQQPTDEAKLQTRNVRAAYEDAFKTQAAAINGKATKAWAFTDNLDPVNLGSASADVANAAKTAPAVTQAKANLKTAIDAWNTAQQTSGFDLPSTADRTTLSASIDTAFKTLVNAYYDTLDYSAANPGSPANAKELVRQDTLSGYEKASATQTPAKTE